MVVFSTSYVLIKYLEDEVIYKIMVLFPICFWKYSGNSLYFYIEHCKIKTILFFKFCK